MDKKFYSAISVLLILSSASIAWASTSSLTPNFNITVSQGTPSLPFLNFTAQDQALENNALQFLSNVFKLNTSAYNTTLLNTAGAPFGTFATLDCKSSAE